MLRLPEILHKIAAMEFKELQAARKEGGEEDYYPRPSLAGPQRCIRQLVYFGSGVSRKELGGRAVLVFDDSSWHEELTADWIRKSIWKLHSAQMEVDCGDGLVGHIDGILTDILGEDYLLEHKALSHFGFEAIARGKELPLDYITQTCLYYRGLCRTATPLSGAILLVKNKNQAAYLEISISYDPATDTAHIGEMVNHLGDVLDWNIDIPNICADAVRKFREVDIHIAAKTLPPRQYEQSHWRCHYCGWGEICWEGWKVEMEAETPGKVKLPATIEQEVAAVSATNAEVKRLENLREERKAAVSDFLKGVKASEGVGEIYRVKLTFQERQTLDREAIPREIREAATKVSCSEILRITKNKEDDDADENANQD